MSDNIPTLKTPREWQGETGIEILDADGWRGRTGRDFAEPISESEFRYRASFSTIRTTKPVWNESPQEEFEAAMEKGPGDDEDVEQD